MVLTVQKIQERYDEYEIIYEKYEKAAENAADYLVSQISPDGYISAAKDYGWYKPHWFRDSSWVAFALLNYAGYLKDKGKDYAKYLNAANRIIGFNIGALQNYIPNIKRSLELRLEDEEFFELRNHVPARVGRSKQLYEDGRINDKLQLNEKRSWLLQYDVIPLILLSLYRKDQLFGLDAYELSFLKENTHTIAKYLGKIFGTECSSEWEIESDLLHAYDIAAIHFAFNVLKEFSEKYELGVGREDLNYTESALYNGGPLQFIKRYFVYDKILYRVKRKFENTPVIEKGVGASAVFIFLTFGITGEDLGDENIETRTIEKVERELFKGNMLPIRFVGDTYFDGGRWLLLGLYFSEYYAKKGNLESAINILDYVIEKYKGSYPEQEIVDPESPGADTKRIEENGGKPIQDLAWSYAAVIDASLAIISAIQESVKNVRRI